VKRWVPRFAAGAAVSGLMLAALLSLTDTKTVRELFARTHPLGLLSGFVLYALAYVPRALRLRLVGLRAPGRTLFHIACLHAAIGKLLPMRAGDLSYPFLARRFVGQGLGEAFIGLLYLRVLDIVGVAVLFSGTLLRSRTLYRGDMTWSLAGALVLLSGSLCALLWLLPLLRAAIRAGERLFGPRALLERARQIISNFPKLGLRAHVALGALTLAAWLLVYGTFHALLLAFGVATTGARTVLGATAGIVASVLPVQGLGSFGTLEAGWAAGMALIGMDLPTAVATGVGVQVFTFSYAMLLGTLGWLGLRTRPARQP